MKRAVYDKQFKMAEVKMSQSLQKSTQMRQKNYLSVGVVCAVGLMNMMNIGKVHFPGMGMHFSIQLMKLRNSNFVRNLLHP